MKKLAVGDIVYSLNVGNAARRREQFLTPCEVVKVGNKFFYTKAVSPERYLKGKFYIDGWAEVTNYSSNQRLYSTEQEYLDEIDGVKYLISIKGSLDMYGKSKLSLGALIEIDKIIKEDIK